MSKRRFNTNSKNIFVARLSILLTMLTLFMSASSLFFSDSLYAAPYVYNRSLKMSSSVPGQGNVTYAYSFEAPNIATLGSIKLSLCSNSPLPEVSCDGFNGAGFTSANLVSQLGTNGFSILPNPTQTEIILTRVASVQANNMVSFTFDNITNPNDVGSYFGRIELFNSTNATGPAIFAGGTANSINNLVGISTEVPPYLYFCVSTHIVGLDCSNLSGVFEDFGEFSTTSTKTAQSQFLAATNAGSGYTVSYIGNELTSGNNTISSSGTLATSQIGVSQFGLNLRKNNSIPVGEEPAGMPPNPIIANKYNTPDRYSFKSGDFLVSINQPSYFNKYTVSYMVNVDKNQRPGVYNTTLIYVCLANF